MKRQLSAAEAFDLRQALHIATLDALMSSRRWAPGDLVFQGGTSLHLVHGSPRYSEDLDFLVNSSLKLERLADTVKTRLDRTSWIPSDTSLEINKVRDARNPHSFVVSIGGPQVIGAVRVKVEMWKTDEQALSSIKAVVAPVRLAHGPAAGAQAFVPTADLSEIYADKVFALAARSYMKPRDIFDLHWLRERGGPQECSSDDLQVRLTTYPNVTPAEWLRKAFERRMELLGGGDMIAADLARWLPSSWPMSKADAEVMAKNAIVAIEQGIDAMREIETQLTNKDEGPTP